MRRKFRIVLDSISRINVESTSFRKLIQTITGYILYNKEFYVLEILNISPQLRNVSHSKYF